MKFLTILVLLFITTFAFGQNYGGGSHKIDDSEKRRLENQFKALGTFYIDDSGLVVYQKQESDNTENSSQEVKKEEPKRSESSMKVNKDKEQSENIPVVVKRTAQKESASDSEVNATPNLYADKAPVNMGYIKKTTKVETAGFENKKTEKAEPKEASLKNQKDNLSTPVEVEKSEDVKPKTTSSKSKKNSVLNQKRASKYKTMEEAALAVEALLEELKKEQVQTTSSGSMSSKLSRGVNKNLRKKAGVNSSGNYGMDSYSSNVVVKKQETSFDDFDSDSEFGSQPSYFINGKQVEKIEVNKLRKKDIINKEIRVRNTVTGNPNGEVWYEVKEGVLQ